ncbi:hypothetical protein CHS0354_003769 [Potamilus streckersoni]|uniref:Peroxidase n=1 Tax=Potamilus streckersoni TaxID=2493646 RepID=A0AAE0RQK6_9BIVA|nr:hypothetical protein CHS0354_003769 [Potamilus streckersoni]
MRRLINMEITLIVSLTLTLVLALRKEMSPQMHNHARRVIEEARKHYLQLLDTNEELKRQIKGKRIAHSKHQSFHGRNERAHSISLVSRAIVGSVDAMQKLGFTLEELRDSGVYDMIQKEFQDIKLCNKNDYVCNAESPYRTPDGSCNNLDNPTWGKCFEPQRRILPAAYDNGVDSPRTRSRYTNRTLPNPRAISNIIHRQEGNEPIMSDRLSLNVFQMGQFLNHDFIGTPLETDEEGKLDCCKDKTRKECFPVLIPKGDPHFPDGTCFNFVRSAGSTANCRPGIKQQQNQVTSYLDLSQVYGPTSGQEESLRDEGYMLMDSDGALLPPPRRNKCQLINTEEHCFLSGDARVHENPSLASYHTLFAHRHNIIAKSLETLHANWTKERIFQEAKKINVAMYQHVLYNEFFPAFMSARALKKYNIKSNKFGYSNSYNSTLDATTANELGIAFRFGHSMIPPEQVLSIPNKPPEVFSLVPNFDNPHLLYLHNKSAPEYLLRWLYLFPGPEMDSEIVPEVRDHLFDNDIGFSLDLVVLNIQRGRDHGLQPYGEYRKWCGLTPLTERFDSLVDHDENDIKRLRMAYKDPRDIDLFSGLVSERQEPGSSIGKTLNCIIGSQFQRYKQGDRYWYENLPPAGFTLDQLNEIRKSTLAMIICSIFDVDKIQRNAFKLPDQTSNPMLKCDDILDIDFTKWQFSFEPVKSLGVPVFDELSKILRDFGAF